METPSKKNEAMSKSPRSGRKASKKENVMKNVFAILAISAISLIGSTAFAAVPVACDPNEQSTGAIIMAFDKAKDCTPTSYEKLKADLATKNCKVTDLVEMFRYLPSPGMTNEFALVNQQRLRDAVDARP